MVPRISVQTSRKKGSKSLDAYRDTSVSRETEEHSYQERQIRETPQVFIFSHTHIWLARESIFYFAAARVSFHMLLIQKTVNNSNREAPGS